MRNGQTAEELSALQFCDPIFLTFSIRFYKSFNGVRAAVVAFGEACVTYGLSGFGLHLIPAFPLHLDCIIILCVSSVSVCQEW